MATIVYADGPTAPRVSPAVVASAAGLSGEPVELLLGWTLERHPWLDDPTLNGRTVLAGYGLAGPVAEGRIESLRVRLSRVPDLLRRQPPDAAVIAAVRRADGYAFSGSVGWGDVAARVAERVVVELDTEGVDLGGPAVDGNIVAVVERPRGSTPTMRGRPADDVDLRIGATVAALLPNEPTLQFGPGGVGEGIARSLDRPVQIWSGLCTDSMAELDERSLLAGPAVAAYTFGSQPVTRLADRGQLRLEPTTVTHNVDRLAAIPNFVGCNTALQVGLDGSVNVERVGDRVIAAIGGHTDFCDGASRSDGGLSIIAVRAGGAARSTIVPAVDVVSTPGDLVDVVVTEHGVADLRGGTAGERAARLVAVAAPEHRDALRATSPA